MSKHRPSRKLRLSRTTLVHLGHDALAEAKGGAVRASDQCPTPGCPSRQQMGCGASKDVPCSDACD
jgi:hypothetical protein